MTMVLAWLAFPLVASVATLGIGLLVAGIAGTRIRPPLLMPVGLAGMVVLGQPLVMTDATAELAVPVVAAAAAAGLARSLPMRRPATIDPWPAFAAVGAFAVYAAPVLLSGEPTLGGYMELDDTASWLALTDWAIHHGASAEGLPPSSYEATLDFYIGSAYPLGAFLPLGVGSRVLGEELAWLWQPYIAYLAAMLALVLYELAVGAVESRQGRAFAAFLAAQPALLFAYALWGGAKELAAAVLVTLMSVLVPLVLAEWGRIRALIPLALAAAATLAVLSSGGGVWVLPVLLLGLGAAIRSYGAREVAGPVAAFAVLLAVLALPALLAVRFLAAPAASTITQEERLANLIQPLSVLQVLGVWPTGEFRLPPDDLTATYLLVAVVAVGAVLGLVQAWRRRAWALPLLGGAAAIGGCVVVVFGSAWLDAKALAIASPAVVLAAGAGATALIAGGRRVEGALMALAVAGGILWSNALAYAEVNLAPAERLAELERIGRGVAGRGPTLMTEYEPYGVRYFLRRGDPEGASELRRREVRLRGGKMLPKGRSADIGELAPDAVLTYRTLVLRRSPFGSRPPAPYELVLSGRFYEVWQRPEAGGPHLAGHLSLRGDRGRRDRMSCREIGRLARRAGRHGRMAAAPAPPILNLDVVAGPPAGWRASVRRPGAFLPNGPGQLEGRVVVTSPGDYELWLGGSFRGEVTILIDGRRVAETRHELGHDHPFVPIGGVRLRAGAHRVALRLGGADLHPGSAGKPFPLGPLLVARSNDRSRLLRVDPRRYRELCSRRLDWVELLRR